LEGYAPSSRVTAQGTVFLLRHGQAKRVEVFR